MNKIKWSRYESELQQQSYLYGSTKTDNYFFSFVITFEEKTGNYKLHSQNGCFSSDTIHASEDAAKQAARFYFNQRNK